MQCTAQEVRADNEHDIVAHCLRALVAEGLALLEQNWVNRESDIDVICIAGLGFPRYRGGPIFLARAAPETVGLKAPN